MEVVQMLVKEMVADISYYAPIKSRILNARENFLTWGNSLPYPISEITLKLSKSNKDGPLPGAILGERYAFWIGELLGAREEIQQKVAIGCIAGFIYVIGQDHCIDEETQTNLHEELLKNLLYAKLIQSFKSVTKDEDKFWHYFNEYLQEYTEGCLWESVEGRNPRLYSTQNLKMVANRSALVKNCVSSLAIATGKEREILKYCSAIEQFVIGLQIRDDLADLLEDLGGGRYTYPMSRLLEGNRANLFSLQTAMLYTNTVESLLDESTQYLRRTSGELNLPDSSALQSYIDFIADENSIMKCAIVRIKDIRSLHSERVQPTELPLDEKETVAWDEIHSVILNDIQY